MEFFPYFLLFITSATALKCNEFPVPEINFPKDYKLPDFIKTSTPFVRAEEKVKISGKIISGLLAEEEKRRFPYQAYLILFHPSLKVLSCGGAILNERWILTAGHCTFGVYYVTVGVGSNSNQKMLYQNSSVIITHPDFNPMTLQNDIGLIQLCKALIFNKAVNAIKLPSEPTCTNFVGTECTVSGFGGTENNMTLVYDDLRFTTVRIISNIDGMVTYQHLATPKLFFTVGSNDSSPCMGDSGGPLTMLDKISNTQICIGVVSFGSTNCGKDPTGYTRVDQYLVWIKKYIFDIKP